MGIEIAWKSRLVEEYKQLKERYNKLKRYNVKREVERFFVTIKPEDEYRDQLMRKQQDIMGEYLHILELRMTNEGIEYED